MTKVRAQDATKELSTNAAKLMEDLSRMRKQAQEALGTLRKAKDEFVRRRNRNVSSCEAQDGPGSSTKLPCRT